MHLQNSVSCPPPPIILFTWWDRNRALPALSKTGVTSSPPDLFIVCQSSFSPVMRFAHFSVDPFHMRLHSQLSEAQSCFTSSPFIISLSIHPQIPPFIRPPSQFLFVSSLPSQLTYQTPFFSLSKNILGFRLFSLMRASLCCYETKLAGLLTSAAVYPDVDKEKMQKCCSSLC